MTGHVSDAVIRRLPGYYRHLQELEAEGVTQISSRELGARMGLTPSQIRQDINCFGEFGRQGYGYSVPGLRAELANILGLTRVHRMIIVGAGNIGSALLQYPTFRQEGFEVLAAFDTDPAKIGQRLAGVPVLAVSELSSFAASNPIDVAVLAVPASAAQETARLVTDSGIRAIWNFAPTDLRQQEGVVIVNVHLSDSLQILSYLIAHPDQP